MIRYMQKFIYIVLFSIIAQTSIASSVNLNNYTAIALTSASTVTLVRLKNSVLSTEKAKSLIGQSAVNDYKKINGMIDTVDGRHQIFHISLNDNIKNFLSIQGNLAQFNNILPKILFIIDEVQENVNNWGRFIALHINNWKPASKLSQEQTEFMNEFMRIANGTLHISLSKVVTNPISSITGTSATISQTEMANRHQRTVKTNWLEIYQEKFAPLEIKVEKLTNTTTLNN